MKRTIETYIIYLKEDLKIADTCKTIKDGLLKSITDKTHFSEELAAYFERDNPNVPFKVNTTDPTQVAVLKKLLNALENAEKSFRAIENIDISRDRYTAMIAKDAVMVSYKAVHEIYAALQLINHSNSDIQDIVGPHIQKLLPQMALASKALGNFAPEHPEESAGAVLAGVVNMLPTEKPTESESLGKLSNLIFELPHYFEELQKLIATGASGIATKSITSAEDYQSAMIKKANETKYYFEQLSSKSGLSAIPSYLSIVKRLIAHSTDLVNAGAPLTKQAYLDAVAKLEDIKHNILPQLISELEMVEESMGLKPGLLTDPALEQMNKYYTQLAEQVDNIAKAAGVLDTVSDYSDSIGGKIVRFLAGDSKKLDVGPKLTSAPDLGVLMDDVFIQKRRSNQESRLNEARLGSEDKNVLAAANRFFDKIGSYNSIHKAWSKWSLANISQSEKDALIKEYKQFQPHFAALYPDIDKLVVDALTQPTGSNIVSRLYSSDYKQLWSSDHFKQVLSCKDSVLSSIQQSLAQSEFKAKLIEKTMSHSEETAYTMNNKTTNLTTRVQPFEPLKFTLEDDKPVEYYHKKVIAASNQILELERAQKGVAEFFNYIQKKYPHENPSFDSLDESDKEFLRKAYKTFQPQLLALKHDDINTRLVSSLTSSKPTDPPLRLTDLVSLKSGIDDYLNEKISDLNQDKTTLLDKEEEAREEQYAKAPLVARGAELEKQTLFGQMSKLKLSKSVDDFFNKKFQTYLKDNLSPEIWKQLSSNGETLDFDKIPYLEFHKDSPEVAMYKQLINSIHYMKNGLENLESLNDYGDPNNIYHRTRFVMTTFNALVMNICFSKYYVMEAGNNPGLKAIVQEGLDLLKPLEGMPLIGDYLKTTEKQEPPKQNIITAWKKQQAVVESGLSKGPKPKTDQQLISEQLGKIQEAIDNFDGDLEISDSAREKIKTQIGEFAKGISGLSFGPGSAKKILAALTKLETQLSNLDKESPEVTLGKLKDTHSELNAQFRAAAEYTEYHSGQKFGSYSNNISTIVSNFCNGLVSNLPLKQEPAPKGKTPEKSVTPVITGATNPHEVVFGTEHEEFNSVYQPYLLLKRITDEFRDQNNPYKPSFDELKEEAVSYYDKIQPLLESVDPKFDKNFIAKHKESSTLLKAIDEVMSMRQRINNPESSFAKLKDLHLEGDFEKEENKEKFRQLYKEIQPYLHKIDSTYDQTQFLEGLKTAKDFSGALQRIMNEENALQQSTSLKDTSYLQLIAESLYQIPVKLNKLKAEPDTPEPSKEEIDANVKAFVEGLNGLSFGPGSVKKILSTAAKLQMQLSDIGKEGRELTMGRLKEIQAEFGTILMAAADNAEFHLGLKPGTYSRTVSERFEKFYSSLIVNLPLEKDQTGLELLIDTTSTQKRLAREMERLERVKEDTSAIDTKKSIFGTEHEQFSTLYQPYASLRHIAKDIEDGVHMNLYERTLEELKVEASNEYKKIQPYLAKINPEFTEDYISKTDGEYSLLHAIDRVFEERHKINKPSSPFDKLRDLYLDGDFEKEENKEQFLQLYAELQPHLIKINYQYDLAYFLRELQTPEDFKAATERIINDESKLQELITGLDDTKRLKVKLCEERIGYFIDLLKKQELEVGPEKIQAFKEKIFFNYIHANVNSALEAKIGSHAEQFLQFIEKDFLDKKNEILEKITIDQDMEEEIAKAIDRIAPDIINNKIESFKKLLFDSYIQSDIKSSLHNELGIYTSLFIDKISPEIHLHQSEILGNVTFDSKMGAEIGSKINAITPGILLNNNPLKEAYVDLNNTLKEINTLLDEENKKARDNPCRNEKIAKLTSLKDRLSDLDSIPKENTVEFLKKMQEETRSSLKSLESNDALINIYDVLNSLKETIENGSDLPEIKKDKLQMISDVQNILSNSDKDTAERLNLAVQILNDSNPEVLSKTKGNFLIGEAFKGQVFTNYINTKISEQLNNELGPYGKVFLKQIMPDFIAKKSEIIKEIAIDNMETGLETQFKIHAPAIFEKNKELKAAYEQLNVHLKEVQSLIEAEEKKPKGNPCREEKIAALRSHQSQLMNTQRIPDHETLRFLQEQNKSAKSFMGKLEKYDTMISVYDSLTEIREHVSNHKSLSKEIKDEKIQEISKMEDMLKTTSKEPSIRLAEVKAHGLSDQCKNVLLKNSDNFLVSFFKTLFSKLFNIKNENETLVSSFKQRLQNIKGPEPVATPMETPENEAPLVNTNITRF
ncbi:TPA: Dot/Icm T4SS effector SidH [Legionella pneumophila]